MRQPEAFSFRPWVRDTCKKAIFWGVGASLLLGLIMWFVSEPGSEPVTRAFGALLLYGLLFLATLVKIWWTASGDAVVLEEDALAYQPLHTFRPRRIALDSIWACAPKTETQSLRLVYEASPDRGREFFLNLGVIEGRSRFLSALGERLEERGLVRQPEARWGWSRPNWSETDS